MFHRLDQDDVRRTVTAQSLACMYARVRVG